ncbi:MAG: hypothetical protein O7E52_09670 [Candidatus Poribacteria bacterium]|nr:hypothetical protein [Candidatus Poribacteria bacterium]
MRRHFTILTGLLLLAAGLVQGEDRDTKVRNDLKEVQATGLWIYNDLPKGIAEAEKTGKPLLIVFR